MFRTYVICLKHIILFLLSCVYTYVLIIYILLVNKVIYKWPELYIKI